ncbi:MAG: metalloregulator ArsR/SmtB family transcription factor [Kiritimatiellae bacterium]|nr:metalloregulator ArsR/SmtB family transcription factor [Kiritimatiellia bacterium]
MNRHAMRSTLRITKALSDMQRLRIMLLLRSGELCVCQIIAVLGLAPSTVSKHLSILSTAELVDSRKEGRWAYYRLPQGAALKAVKPVLKWLNVSLGAAETALRDARRLADVLSTAGEGKSVNGVKRTTKEC